MCAERIDAGVTNEALDRLLSARRSIRSFTKDAPSREQVDAIIAAGILAPFAQAAVGNRLDFRRFFVFPRGAHSLATLANLLSAKARTELAVLHAKMPPGTPLVQRFEAVASGTIPGVGDAPILIVVAERKGTPAVEQQSLAHCLENMWLKATALGVGFHLVSALAMLAGEPRFAELLGVPEGEFEFNGCAMGVPAVIQPATPRPSVDDVTKWMT